MKILGIKTAYRLTKQKIVNTCCVVVVSALCAASAIAVNTILNFSDVQALRVDSGDMVDVYDVIPAEIAPDRDTYNIKNPVASTGDNAAKLGQTDPTVFETEEPEETEETEEETTTTSEETEETTTETEEETTSESAEPTTSTTQAAQTAKKAITQSVYKRTVYARTTVNIRTGPGTSYKVVKKITVKQAISVVAKTSNGWYKTSDGYYVKQSLTTLSLPRPTATKAPTKKPKTTTKKTTTPKVATKTTVKTVNGVKCKITFYGPVLYKRKDGSTFYSTTTATGTKCKQGRTCAADWKVFPKNSWIYIENDPLGGDGLYKVEDTGRFTGNWIDIYVDSAKGHNTCYRKVYKQ